jgi:hypothetical protein
LIFRAPGLSYPLNAMRGIQLLIAPENRIVLGMETPDLTRSESIFNVIFQSLEVHS